MVDFLKDKPEAVKALFNEVRVMIDNERRENKRPQSNVIPFGRAAKKLDDQALLSKYQELLGPIKDFYYKRGEELTYEVLLQHLNELQQIKESVVSGDEK